MDNKAFERNESLPVLSKANTKSGSQKSAIFGLLAWRELLETFVGKHQKLVNYGVGGLLVALYHAYLVYSIYRHMDKDLPIFQCPVSACDKWKENLTPPRPYWCDSLAFLIIITGFAWICVLYGYFVKPLFGKSIETVIFKPLGSAGSRFLSWKFANPLLYAAVLAVIAVFLIWDTWDNQRRLVGAGGAIVLILVGLIFSVHPGKVRWRHVFWGHSIQFAFALIVLRWNFGKQLVQCLSSKVSTFLDYTYLGAAFVFGHLANGHIFFPDNFRADSTNATDSAIRKVLEELNKGVVDVPFFFGPLSIIYFVSFFVSMLFYWGTLQFVVQKLGWLLYVTVGTTAAESMNAAANIFLGQTEAPLLIRPYLPTMTNSEINAVMTGGFATIAGTILGAYIAMGIDPGHLITCSFMAAPASLAVSKLFYPETEESKTTIKDIKVEKGEESNVLDAAAKGASTAIMLVLNIGASLLAFYAFIKFLDDVVAWFGHFAGWDELSFTYLLGYALYPVAFLIGIAPEDCKIIGKLIGMKMLITEFPAFTELARLHEGTSDLGTIQERSFVIATYALCGFANFPSIGIQIGAFGAMAPERKSDIAKIALRAMLGGCWVSFLNACIAGALLD